MAQQIPVDQNAVIPDESDGVHEVSPTVAYQRTAIVNVMYVGPPGAPDRGWVLIDAGVTGYASRILATAKTRFGDASRPAAILLTHGHFDHVGVLESLAETWDVPVYAHPLEHPYLDGRSSYPPPDPTVGGGMMAKLSGLYPRGPIDLGPRLKALPEDGTVPHLPGWAWLFTPGHTPGHVSFWQPRERTLIAGDAVITTQQESAYAVMTQRPELHGPPRYYTPDWVASKASVERLAALQPERLVTGHGPALEGAAMRTALAALARDFDRVAVPDEGRYVPEPARADAGGVTYVPPKP